MRRRQFLGVLGAAAIGLPKAVAQKPLPRIGFLASGGAASINSELQVRTIKRGLEANGLIEGRDYIFEARFPGVRYEQFPELARELAQAGARVILANTVAAVRAGQGLVPPVAVVMMSIDNPVGNGLIASLARPGGQTTGVAGPGESLIPRLLELQRTILPKAASIAVIYNPANPSNPAFLMELRGRAGGASVTAIEVSSRDQLEAAFVKIDAHRPDLLWVISDSGLLDLNDRIAALALMHRLPTFATSPEFARLGGMIACGASREKFYLRATWYVKKILEGANASDLPVEQPSQIELWINMKAATTLGVAIPQSLRATADEVIQ